MASLFNTKISATYPSLIKTLDTTAVTTATLKLLSDGNGTSLGLSVNNQGDFKVNAILEWGSLKDTGTGITITNLVNSTATLASNKNDTTIPTSKAVSDYVDGQVTLVDLDFLGDSNTGNPAVDLDSQSFRVLGTTNQITTSGENQTLTLSLPSTVHRNLQGNVTGNLTGNVTGNVTGDVTGDLTGDSAGTHTGAVVGNVTGNLTGNVTGNLTGTVTATSVLANGVTATSQAVADDSTKVATTAFVQDAIGTIPAGLVFQGTWNATTNSPSLSSGSGTTGHFYIVSVAGSTDLDGITDWKVGDWAVFVEQGASDQWEKVDNSSVLDGNGTGGKITKWAGSGNSVTLTDSVMTELSSNIGIGTANPSAKLDLRLSTTTGKVAEFHNSVGYGIGFTVGTDAGVNTINSETNQALAFATNGASNERMRIDSAGAIKFNTYGAGTLVSDASGNITSISGGGEGGPYLPLAGGTMTGTGEIRTPDNFKLKVGTSGDMEIYHNATDTYIDNQTGNLIIQNGANDKDIRFKTDNGSGGTTTYFTIDGVNEINQFSKNVSFPDNVIAKFGNSSDLQIYHDGSNSYIKDSGTGNLNINATNLALNNGAGTKTYLLATDGGSVQLRHNDSTKLETTSSGVSVTGEGVFTNTSSGAETDTISLRNSATAQNTATALKFFPTTSTTRFASIVAKNVTGNNSISLSFLTAAADTPAVALTLDSSQNATFAGDVTIGSSGASSDKTLNILTGGTKSSVKLMEAGTVYGFSTVYDGAANKFHINRHNNSAAGTPVLSLNRDDDNATFAGNVSLGDGKLLSLGASNDFQIYHDSSTNVNHIFSNLDRQLSINAGITNITNQANSVNYARFESTGTTFSGNVGIGSFPTSKLQLEQSIVPRITMIKTGVLSWYVGNPTQGSSSNFTIGTDSGSNLDILTLDTSGNATFAGQITASKNQNATSSFTFQNTDTTGTNVRTHLNATAGNRSIRLESIHNDYSYIVSTNRMYFQSGTSNTLLLDGNNATFAGDVGLADGKKLTFGASDDLEIYHDGSNSFIRENGTGVLTIDTNGSEIQFNKGTSDYMLRLTADAGVKAYYDNSLKFETTSSGVSVTGNIVVNTTSNGSNVDNVVAEFGNDVGTTQSRDAWIKSRSSSGSTDKSWAFGSTQAGEFKFNYLGTRATAPTSGTTVLTIGSTGAATFAATANANIVIARDNMYVDAGQFYIGADDGTTDNTFRQAVVSGAFKIESRESGTWTPRLTIDSSGNVLVGKTALSIGVVGTEFRANGQSLFTANGDNSIDLNRLTNEGGIALFRQASNVVGSISVTSSATAYNTSSDYRLKENVVEMTGALDRVAQLKPSRFNFIADSDKVVDGFLAHEVQSVVPEAITGTKDAMKDEEYEVTPAVYDGDELVTEAVMATRSVEDYQGIDQSKLVPLLVGAIQELRAEIELLKNK